MGKKMLEVKNLKTKYVTRFHEDVYAVDGVSFSIEEGQDYGPHRLCPGCQTCPFQASVRNAKRAAAPPRGHKTFSGNAVARPDQTIPSRTH